MKTKFLKMTYIPLIPQTTTVISRSCFVSCFPIRFINFLRTHEYLACLIIVRWFLLYANRCESKPFFLPGTSNTTYVSIAASYSMWQKRGVLHKIDAVLAVSVLNTACVYARMELAYPLISSITD